MDNPIIGRLATERREIRRWRRHAGGSRAEQRVRRDMKFYLRALCILAVCKANGGVPMSVEEVLVRTQADRSGRLLTIDEVRALLVRVGAVT